jgi:hypothetical protein
MSQGNPSRGQVRVLKMLQEKRCGAPTIARRFMTSEKCVMTWLYSLARLKLVRRTFFSPYANSDSWELTPEGFLILESRTT